MVLQNFKDKLDESINRIDQATDQSLLKKIKNLKETRISTDIELRSIADKTKISMKNLKSIESFNFDKLPSEPWRNSFISQYCNFIENFDDESN
ncbi:helix-turn-helix domain-containing protein [Pelagibacteraceae bacterium]|jgi:protein tyrosine/serine phosphatase|nr:helix-turn-helix domain-containing protein [Pelagibacteraceae bacterium]